MKDSYLVIAHGPIRGGKTVTMTGDASLDMIEGRRVFSNYPIAFDYQESPGAPIKHYASEPLIADELLYIDRPDIQRKYTDSVIVWDEGALSLPAREHATAQNKLISQATLLRGKLETSLYFSVQYLSMWEKNMRLQMDSLIFCHDLSFRFRHLERGSTISQAFQDMSGRSTGYTFEETGRVYRQTFHAKPFWYIYDTRKTFPIVRDKIGYGDVRKTLKTGDFDTDDDHQLSQEDENWVIVENLVKEYGALNQVRVPVAILSSAAKGRGFIGKSGDLGALLIQMGVKLYGSNAWDLRPALL